METILNFLNSNSGAIQAILVIVLVSVTIWYAISTKKMADLTNQQYVLSTKPFLYPAREVGRNFKPNYNPINNTSVQLNYLFTNLGRVPVKFFVDEFTLDGESINPQKIDTIFFPNQKGYITSKLYQSTNNIGEGDGLKGFIKVVFWANDTPAEKYFFQRNFTLAPGIVILNDAEDFGKL